LEHNYNSKAKKEHEFGEIGLFVDPNMNKEIDDNDGRCTTCDEKFNEGELAIPCDSCLMREHYGCSGMTEENAPDSDDGYICDLCETDPTRKVKRARIVEMLNAIYGLKGSKTFISKIIPVKGTANYIFKVYSYDGKEMENIVILYSCGKELEELIRDEKKYRYTTKSKKIY